MTDRGDPHIRALAVPAIMGPAGLVIAVRVVMVSGVRPSVGDGRVADHLMGGLE